jgi:enoyl-CoA hydratase
MMQETLFDVQDGVAVITMNRPSARNALNGALCRSLAAAFREVVQREDIRVAILTGAGGHFCSGMDLKAFAQREVISSKGLPMGVDERIVIDKPMLGAVEGYAVAAGFELLGCCDLIVAGRGARFGLAEVKRGLIPAGGGLLWLPRQAPARIVNEMVFTGEPMSAETMLHHGVINRVTEDGAALTMACNLARQIANNGPFAVASCKRILRESPRWTDDQMFERQQPIVDAVFASVDAKEGVTAFAEKRAPSWVGH